MDPEEEFKQKADALLAKASEIDEICRGIGLYVEAVTIVPFDTGQEMQPALAVQFAIGAVAFSDRIQDPEADAVNDEFDRMITNMNFEEYSAVTELLKKNQREGRNPWESE